MSTLDQILPPAETLAHPLSGEVIDRDDLSAIKEALAETQEYVYRPEVRKMYQARDLLQARLGELEPTELPRRANQTKTQERLERCPRCRTPLPRVVITDKVEALGEGEVEASEDAAALPPANRETTDSPSPSAQAELLPTGPRSLEQEEALGIDIFGERSDSAATPSPADVADQPSATTPEEGAASREDSPPSSLTFDPVVAAGQVKFMGGKHALKTVAQVWKEDPDYFAYVIAASKNAKLKAAAITYQEHRKEEE